MGIQPHLRVSGFYLKSQMRSLTHFQSTLTILKISKNGVIEEKFSVKKSIEPNMIL